MTPPEILPHQIEPGVEQLEHHAERVGDGGSARWHADHRRWRSSSRIADAGEANPPQPIFRTATARRTGRGLSSSVCEGVVRQSAAEAGEPPQPLSRRASEWAGEAPFLSAGTGRARACQSWCPRPAQDDKRCSGTHVRARALRRRDEWSSGRPGNANPRRLY
jgi:hypothetical protein